MIRIPHPETPRSDAQIQGNFDSHGNQGDWFEQPWAGWEDQVAFRFSQVDEKIKGFESHFEQAFRAIERCVQKTEILQKIDECLEKTEAVKRENSRQIKGFDRELTKLSERLASPNLRSWLIDELKYAQGVRSEIGELIMQSIPVIEHSLRSNHALEISVAEVKASLDKEVGEKLVAIENRLVSKIGNQVEQLKEEVKAQATAAIRQLGTSLVERQVRPNATLVPAGPTLEQFAQLQKRVDEMEGLSCNIGVPSQI